MCGVLGIFGPSAGPLAPGAEVALGAMAHRGPDGRGTWKRADGQCLLGHTRLAIIDLSPTGAQPMDLGDGQIAYNGEIYNHLRLRANLEGEGRVFRGRSDTETLLQGLLGRGSDFLTGLEGMYAGLMHDARDGSLLAFRDPLGIKPLYYLMRPDSTVVFASEIATLLAAIPDAPRRVNRGTLACYFAFENYPQKETLFEGIHAFEPGTWWRLRMVEGRVRIETGTIPIPTETSVPPSEPGELRQAIRDELERTVSLHLLSDVPLGVYLSGGIDSSIVATLASRRVPGLLGFTGWFEEIDPYYDERPLSRSVARAAGIELNEVRIHSRQVVEHFDTLLRHLGQPRMGMGSFSQFIVAREAARERKVMLAGHGGDELFSGYPIFKAMWLMQHRGNPAMILATLARLKGKEWPWVLFLAMKRLQTGRTFFAPEIWQDALGPIQPYLDSFTMGQGAPLASLQAYYQRIYLPGLLVVEDGLSMAHSLETRLPLWSQRLIAWANRIPMDLKMPGGRLKGLLREAASPWLPPEILTAPKRGFPTPMRLWFRGALADWAKERLLEGPPSPLDEWVPKESRKRLLEAHLRRPLPFAMDERRAHRIWMLLNLESWIRQYRLS